MLVHLQIEYKDKEGNGVESTLSIQHDHPDLAHFIKEWQEAVQHDPDAKLVFGGQCHCGKKV